MSWNNRVLDHGTHFALHEVFYHDDDSVRCWTVEPVGFVSPPEEGVAGLALQLERALRDARGREVRRVVDLPE